MCNLTFSVCKYIYQIPPKDCTLFQFSRHMTNKHIDEHKVKNNKKPYLQESKLRNFGQKHRKRPRQAIVVQPPSLIS